MQIRKRIKVPTAAPESTYDKQLEEELTSFSLELSELLNGGLKFADNFNCQIKSVTDTGNADTEFAVAHTLKRVPTGFILINSDKACAVYDSGTSWTTTNIYLKCDAANAAIKLIIL
jgi:hypothetical protein